jgi:Winged helix-turn-helix DNA-binding
MDLYAIGVSSITSSSLRLGAVRHQCQRRCFIHASRSLHDLSFRNSRLHQSFHGQSNRFRTSNGDEARIALVALGFLKAPPTEREIAGALGISKTNVHYHIAKLREAGELRKIDGG